MLDQAENLRALAYGKENIRRPKIITVTSGKGGVGKSNLVVNLSIAIQKLGKNVLIFDADVGMGNDDVLMGFMSRYNVFDVVYKNMNIDEVTVTGPFGVRLLPGGSGLSRLEEMTAEQREDFIKKLNGLEDIDYIIMDTGAGINRSVLGFISCCDELIIITTPEPTSITDAYSLLKVVNHFKLKAAAKIVVNRVMDIEEGIATYEKFNNAVETFLKMKLEHLGSISEDKKLVQAVRKQEPFILKYPNSSASKDVEELAKKIIGTAEDGGNTGVQGFFKKIFSIFS